MGTSNSLLMAMENMLVLYQKRIRDRVVVRIVQIYQDADPFQRKRSQFLAIVIEDERMGRWVCLRLSTFRKVIAFLVKKGFAEARRLTEREVLILKRREEDRHNDD